MIDYIAAKLSNVASRFKRHQHTGTDGSTTLGSGVVTSAMILDGTIATGDMAAGGTSTVLQTNSGGTVAWSTVTSAMIADGAIVNDDINASAAIAASKLATGTFGGSGVTTFPGILRLVSTSAVAFDCYEASLDNGNSAAVSSASLGGSYGVIVFANRTTGQVAVASCIYSGGYTNGSIYNSDAANITIGSDAAGDLCLYWNGSQYVLKNNTGVTVALGAWYFACGG